MDYNNHNSSCDEIRQVTEVTSNKKYDSHDSTIINKNLIPNKIHTTTNNTVNHNSNNNNITQLYEVIEYDDIIVVFYKQIDFQVNINHFNNDNTTLVMNYFHDYLIIIQNFMKYNLSSNIIHEYLS